jgi:hypothetical protein
MDKKFRNRIKVALRRLTWSWEPYKEVKAAAKVDKGTYECGSCGKFCYTGKSESSYAELTEKYPDKCVEMCSIYIDHTDPVEPLQDDWKGWDDHINRLFCSADNLSPMCKSCHDIKTKQETEIRKQYRKEKKSGSTKTS